LGNGLRLSVDTATGKIELDRSQAGEAFATEFGTSRATKVAAGEIVANIFIDRSIFEIFINKGEKVFTGRVFPTADQTGIEVVSGQITGRYFESKK
jgi:beta-fructofuranosidase